MSRATLKAIQAAAGNAGGEATYVEDVFSTYLYEGNGSSQFINNGIDLGSYPFANFASTDGNSVSGSETFTVNVKADTKLVVFALDSNSSILSCTLDGASLTAKTTSTSFYGVAVFIETLTAGTHTIVVGDNGIGNTEVMLFDPNATVSVQTNLTVSAQGDTSVTTSSVTTDGFCVFLGADRDSNANFSANQTSTKYYESAHTYFYFGAIGINGSSGTVPATTISGMVGTYATNWCLLKVEGIGNDPTANSAASGEGGLVWLKNRDSVADHHLFDFTSDTATIGYYLETNNTNSQAMAIPPVTAQSAGFGLPSTNAFNQSGVDFASWTFRKQPGFFDVVTWTGDGSTTTHSHNLGSTPAVIIVKRRDSTSSWSMYHRDAVDGIRTGEDLFLYLNTTAAASYLGFPAWSATDSTFTTVGGGGFNASGGTYVAYLFADNAQDFGTNSNEPIIKCGSFTATQGVNVELGFEPQWIMVKSSTSTSDWYMFDNMRGWGAEQGSDDRWIYANSSNAEVSSTNSLGFHATGFTSFNGGAATYIYIAIRRPHKPASELAATDLFAIDTRNSTGDGKEPGFRSGFPVDMNIFRTNIIQSNAARVSGRLTENKYLETSSTNAELIGSTTEFDYMNGWLSSGGTSAEAYSWMFRRAPGFFDVVAYTGDGTSSHAISHNLGVTPELMIVKRRNVAASWYVWESSFAGTNDFIFLNSSNAKTSASTVFPSDPTSSNFTVGSSAGINNSGDTFIAYLFATVPGISKVGSYSGTGSAVDVDCGFTSGARFVLVKRTDSTGDWYVWDSVRGIVAGNDPYVLLNSNAAEVTSTDYIDPLSSGFTITSTAPAALNASGGNYIFLAVA